MPNIFGSPAVVTVGPDSSAQTSTTIDTNGQGGVVLVAFVFSRIANSTNDITFANTSFSLIGTIGAGDYRLEMWELVAPPVTNAPVVLNVLGGSSENAVLVAVGINGVDTNDPRGPVDTASDLGQGLTVWPLTNSTNELAIASIGYQFPSLVSPTTPDTTLVGWWSDGSNNYNNVLARKPVVTPNVPVGGSLPPPGGSLLGIGASYRAAPPIRISLSGSSDSSGGLASSGVALRHSGAMGSGGALRFYLSNFVLDGITDSAGVLDIHQVQTDFFQQLSGATSSIGTLGLKLSIGLAGTTNSVGDLAVGKAELAVSGSTSSAGFLWITPKIGLAGTTASSGTVANTAYTPATVSLAGSMASSGAVGFKVSVQFTGLSGSSGDVDSVRFRDLETVSLVGETPSSGALSLCFPPPPRLNLGGFRFALRNRMGAVMQADLDEHDLNWAINAAYRHIATRYRHKATRREHVISVISGVRDYPLPSRVVAVYSVHNRSTGRRLKKGLWRQRPKFMDANVMGEPTVYMSHDGAIRLYPVPDKAYTLEVVALTAPALLQCDEDIPVLHPVWDDGILLLAEWYAWMLVPDAGKAQLAYETWRLWMREQVHDVDEEQVDYERHGIRIPMLEE